MSGIWPAPLLGSMHTASHALSLPREAQSSDFGQSRNSDPISLMLKRDFAALLLSCIAVLVSLQNEGTFTFRKAWCADRRRSIWIALDPACSLQVQLRSGRSRGPDRRAAQAAPPPGGEGTNEHGAAHGQWRTIRSLAHAGRPQRRRAPRADQRDAGPQNPSEFSDQGWISPHQPACVKSPPRRAHGACDPVATAS